MRCAFAAYLTRVTRLFKPDPLSRKVENTPSGVRTCLLIEGFLVGVRARVGASYERFRSRLVTFSGHFGPLDVPAPAGAILTAEDK
jgi:hypothetical protein